MPSLIPAWTFLPDKDVCTLKWINVFSVQCFLSFPAIFLALIIGFSTLLDSYLSLTFVRPSVAERSIFGLGTRLLHCLIHVSSVSFMYSFPHSFITLFIYTFIQSISQWGISTTTLPPLPPFLYGPQEARRRKNLLTRLLFIYIISVLLSLVFSFFSKMAFFIASCNRHFNCRRRRSIPPIL